MAQVIFISRDLLFQSQVASAARQLSISVQVVGSLASAKEALQQVDARLLILDLSTGIAPNDASSLAGTDRPLATLAFAPHVEHNLLAAATAAGFQHVMPRSKFSSQLSDWLRLAMTPLA
jgi:DNA-binding NarL/FixJ family response regulator